MNSMYNNRKYGNRMASADSVKPRGIHHTVSYAVSFNDTWTHIRSELKKTYRKEHMEVGV